MKSHTILQWLHQLPYTTHFVRRLLFSTFLVYWHQKSRGKIFSLLNIKTFSLQNLLNSVSQLFNVDVTYGFLPKKEWLFIYTMKFCFTFHLLHEVFLDYSTQKYWFHPCDFLWYVSCLSFTLYFLFIMLYYRFNCSPLFVCVDRFSFTDNIIKLGERFNHCFFLLWFLTFVCSKCIEKKPCT